MPGWEALMLKLRTTAAVKSAFRLLFRLPFYDTMLFAAAKAAIRFSDPILQ